MAEDKLHIIAEAGSNHNGKPALARELVDIAVDCGADSVKFQIINPWGLYLPGEYKYGHYDIKEVIRIRKEGQLSDEAWASIAGYAREKGISFSASVFDEPGLDLLLSFDPPYVKTASCDLNNLRFLRQIAERGKKMVISTGMSTLRDIEKAIHALTKMNFTDIVLLHCVSIYPAPLGKTNLKFISVLREQFGFPVGFSDHTSSSIAACMALCEGATWFEKHFTMDKRLEGFDHAHAQDAAELKQYVQDIHEAWQALQPPADKLSDDERYTRQRARRSLYAARDLPAGHVLRDADVLIVRPENVMDADQIDLIIGQALKTAVKQYEPFAPAHFDHLEPAR